LARGDLWKVESDDLATTSDQKIEDRAYDATGESLYLRERCVSIIRNRPGRFGARDLSVSCKNKVCTIRARSARIYGVRDKRLVAIGIGIGL